MSTNHTPNYNLSQWVKSDQVLMEDFNADNAKIDAAIKGEADARAAAVAGVAAQLSAKGNCQIWTTTYIGNGKTGRDNPPTQITFPSMPLAAFIISTDGAILSVPLISGEGRFMGTNTISAKWSGTTVSWFSNYDTAQMNANNMHYIVIAFYQR